MPEIAGAEQEYEGRLQTTYAGAAAQQAWNSGNYSQVAALLNGNSNVGLSVNGVELWGALGAAFATGYGSAGTSASHAFDLSSLVQKGWDKVVQYLKSIRLPDFYIVNVAVPPSPQQPCTFNINITGASGQTLADMQNELTRIFQSGVPG